MKNVLIFLSLFYSSLRAMYLVYLFLILRNLIFNFVQTIFKLIIENSKYFRCLLKMYIYLCICILVVALKSCVFYIYLMLVPTKT